MAYKGRRGTAAAIENGFIIASGVLLLDRAVKLWCVKTLSAAGTIPVIKNVFHLTYTQNRGAAFSMLSGKRWLLAAIAVAAIALIAYIHCSRLYASRLTDIAFPLVVGGAAGNLWDRLAYGYVIDLFDFRLINFAIFNVADIAISCGAGLLILYVLLSAKDGF